MNNYLVGKLNVLFSITLLVLHLIFIAFIFSQVNPFFTQTGMEPPFIFKHFYLLTLMLLGFLLYCFYVGYRLVKKDKTKSMLMLGKIGLVVQVILFVLAFLTAAPLFLAPLLA